MENYEAGKKRERIMGYENRLRKLSDSIEHNISILRVQKKKRKKREQKVYWRKS